MSQKIRVMKKSLLFLMTYTVGVVVLSFFQLGRLVGFIEVMHADRLPTKKGKLLITPNHPTIFEPFIAPMLVGHWWFLRPHKYGPWSTPDLHLFRKWPLFRLGAGRSIPIHRSKANGALGASRRDQVRNLTKAFDRIKEVLREGGIVVLFPEGGRTKSGDPSKLIVSNSGRKLRPLQSSVNNLAVSAGNGVLPVWVEHRPKWFPRLVVNVGHVLYAETEGEGDTDATLKDRLQDALLVCADEVGDVHGLG